MPERIARRDARLARCLVPLKGSLRDALQAIERGDVQIALVMDKSDRLVGVVTDGDIRRALLSGSSLESRLEPLLRREFVSVGPEVGRAAVVETMNARTVVQVPIVERETGRLLGLHLRDEILGLTERPNWAVVMAGGLGTRLHPLTQTVPKPMLRVAGRPILERIVLHLVSYGIRRVFIAVNYLSEQIERHFEDGSRFGCRIKYLREKGALGTGGALSLLPETTPDPLLVLNGDLVTSFDVNSLLQEHREGHNLITVGVKEYSHTIPFGVVEIKDRQVKDIQEKPTVSWRTNAGAYVLEPEVVGRVPKETFFGMPALIEECLQRNERVGAFIIDDDHIDVGRMDELMRARGE
jgi:dTDP-glucose pyrophosphorylase